MFTELVTMMRKGDTIVFSVSLEAPDQLRLVVTPKLFTLDGEKGEDRKALNQPISITGTPAELDSPELVATLNRFAASTNGLRQSIDDVEAAHKVAQQGKTAKAAAKPKDDEKKPANPIHARMAPKPSAEERTEALI